MRNSSICSATDNGQGQHPAQNSAEWQVYRLVRKTWRVPAGCLVATASSFSTGTTTSCVANNRRLGELTVGFRKDLYKGPAGRFALGAQYEYLKREAFEGVGGAPSTDASVIYTSVRYYPF